MTDVSTVLGRPFVLLQCRNGRAQTDESENESPTHTQTREHTVVFVHTENKNRNGMEPTLENVPTIT